jgi:hypothetical protein
MPRQQNGINQKKNILQGIISKKIIIGGKAKLVYFTGVKVY